MYYHRLRRAARMVDRFWSTTVCVHGFGEVGESVLVSSCVNQVKALFSDGLGKDQHGCKLVPGPVGGSIPSCQSPLRSSSQGQLRRHHLHVCRHPAYPGICLWKCHIVCILPRGTSPVTHLRDLVSFFPQQMHVKNARLM